MNKAFSLVELIVGIGLTSILLMAVSLYLVSSLKSTRVTATKIRIKDEAEFLLTSMVRTIKFSRRINECTATKLDMIDTDGSIVVYQWVSGRVNVTWTYPLPTPTVAINLNAVNNSVNYTTAPCNGNLFTCDTNLRTVDICFTMLDPVGTENGSIIMRGKATMLN